MAQHSDNLDAASASAVSTAFTTLPRDKSGRVLVSGLTDYERFIQLINFTDTCWLWTGAVTSSGYGCFKVRVNGKWRAISAHVFSYTHHHGAIPEDSSGKILHIRHSCDVSLCVSPNHLLPGTRKENMQDMIARNRGRMQFGTPERSAIDECPF